MKYLSVVNYNKYQHYKDRNLKWIKLYVDMPVDYKYTKLSNLERLTFISLILVAGTCNNCITYDIPWLMLRITSVGTRITSFKKALKTLIEMNLVAIKKSQPASLDKIRKDKIREDIYNNKKKLVDNLSIK